MREIIEDREFTIEITYRPEELTMIVDWYIENKMPPIFKNYDLENDDIADMIEYEAVKSLLDVGSNRILTDFLEGGKNIIIFTPEEAQGYIDDILDEEEE